VVGIASTRARATRTANPAPATPVATDTAHAHPLDAETRAYMEPRFGHDFANVRVHAGDRAAASAKTLGAQAYTIGDDIVMGEGRYRPHTPEGRGLLAHELAHVVQQQGAPGAMQMKAVDGAVRLGAADTAAEREADTAAARVGAGEEARVTQRISSGTVQRTVGGSLMGTIAGAGIGAVALGMVGGLFGLAGLGMGLGAAIGGLIGLVRGGAGSEPGRKLNSDERSQAQRVYGPSLDYDRVRIAVSRVMTFPSHARTPYETLYLPPDTIPDPADLDDDLVAEAYYKLLVHELCHVWQTQNGVGATRKAFTAMFGSYTYGGAKALRKAWAAGKHFVDFGWEQQAEICADYWARLFRHRDTSAHRPYIMELQAGGRKLAPGMIPSSDPGDFPTSDSEESAV
jgi:hypothetical protein